MMPMQPQQPQPQFMPMQPQQPQPQFMPMQQQQQQQQQQQSAMPDYSAYLNAPQGTSLTPDQCAQLGVPPVVRDCMHKHMCETVRTAKGRECQMSCVCVCAGARACARCVYE